MIFTWICLAGAALLVAADQLMKYWANTSLSQVDTLPLIDGVLHLTYHQNYGAAFSILQGKRVFLLAFTGIMLLAILVLLLSRRIQNRLLTASLSLILSGGVGNLLDRLLRDGGFVVDYIDFRLIHFPVFNLADICVCVGTGLLIMYVFLAEGRHHEPRN